MILFAHAFVPVSKQRVFYLNEKKSVSVHSSFFMRENMENNEHCAKTCFQKIDQRFSKFY